MSLWRRAGRCRGSSPHTRGALAQSANGHGSFGIIPAYAGSTSRRCCDSCHIPDHPRIRGEHAGMPQIVPLCPGSSPHTRGALGPPPQPAARRRIIPAYAGSTSRRLPGRDRCWDHPRIRGEHTGRSGGRTKNVGSSPHTRGARIRRAGTTGPDRIIPAYAGSTPQPSSGPPSPADHPRIRGEHELVSACSDDDRGSSPHTRGAQRRETFDIKRRGIIPAYAGSTRTEAIDNSLVADHPRIRGEH